MFKKFPLGEDIRLCKYIQNHLASTGTTLSQATISPWITAITSWLTSILLPLILLGILNTEVRAILPKSKSDPIILQMIQGKWKSFHWMTQSGITSRIAGGSSPPTPAPFSDLTDLISFVSHYSPACSLIYTGLLLNVEHVGGTKTPPSEPSFAIPSTWNALPPDVIHTHFYFLAHCGDLINTCSMTGLN